MTIQSCVSVAIDSLHHSLNVMLAGSCSSSAGKHFYFILCADKQSPYNLYSPPNKIPAFSENCKKRMKMEKKGSGTYIGVFDS